MPRRSMPRATPMDMLSAYAKVLGRKAGFVALGWLLVYFISQPFRHEGDLNILMLFAPMLGALAGLVAGWYLATNAVEDSNMNGLVLWVILVVASVAPMWIVEGIMKLLLGWPMNFGGFMLITAATLLALASAVWHASSQE